MQGDRRVDNAVLIAGVRRREGRRADPLSGVDPAVRGDLPLLLVAVVAAVVIAKGRI